VSLLSAPWRAKLPVYTSKLTVGAVACQTTRLHKYNHTQLVSPFSHALAPTVLMKAESVAHPIIAITQEFEHIFSMSASSDLPGGRNVLGKILTDVCLQNTMQCGHR
jgi:hypothetical protein